MKITREQFKNIVREVLAEESEYQAFFQKALEKSGKSIPSMSDEEKKAFFNKIDSAWNGRGEKNEALVGGQKKLDVDKDGDIEGDDLADLRAGKKVSEAANLKTIKMLIQNKGIKDAVRQHHADNIRKIIEDEGFSTKGVSDSELIKIAKVLTNESVIKEGRYDADLDKIESAVKNASSFMNVGSELKKAGIKYDFTTSMIPMYMIKVSGNTIAICNKKYAAGAEREVKDIAIGLLN